MPMIIEIRPVTSTRVIGSSSVLRSTSLMVLRFAGYGKMSPTA